MRLAPRRRAQWLREREFGEGLAETLVTRSGLAEVVRLGAGEPIVLLPGLAGGRKLLAPLAQRLARRHEVFLVSHRGDRGSALQSQGVTLADYAADVSDVIRALRLERPAVMGVSFGGAVALELAVTEPGSLGRLILQGAEARFQAGVGVRVVQHVLERFPLPTNNRFVNQFFNVLWGARPEPGPLPEFVVDRCWETDQGVMASRIRALESFDVSDRLWQVDVPTLVLAGTRDVVVPLARQRALAESIPGARFAALDGAGHIGFLTHRDEVVRRIGSFVLTKAQSPR